MPGSTLSARQGVDALTTFPPLLGAVPAGLGLR
jgi:hypothetical protein